MTVIEAGLIVSIMLSGAEGGERVARDAVFAAVMIVLNGVVGLCLVLGAGKHFERTFQLQGAVSSLAVLGTLATLALILPNFVAAAHGPSYSILQLEGVGLMSLVLWCVFVFVQAVKHRNYFLDARGYDDSGEAPHEAPGAWTALLSLALLAVSLTAVVLLAKTLSYPVDAAIAAVGLPKAFVGVVIAAIVLMPEGLAATRSALRNQLQNSINLAIGSAIASIGLTTPTVALVSIMLNQQIVLGVSQADMTAHSDPLHLRSHPWHRAHDRAARRRASRDLRRVPAGLGRAVDRSAGARRKRDISEHGRWLRRGGRRADSLVMED